MTTAISHITTQFNQKSHMTGKLTAHPFIYSIDHSYPWQNQCADYERYSMHSHSDQTTNQFTNNWN
jgi:hypothetical protein